MKKLVGILAIAAMLFTASSGLAKEKTFKYCTAAPKGTPWVKFAEIFAENMANTSEGKMKMTVFPAAQLGPEFETIKQVSRGRLDVGDFSVAAAATVVPEIMLMSSPFFWESFEQADCAIDSRIADIYGPLFEKRGLKILQFQELGWQIVFAKKKITLENVKGFKMRVSPAINHNILWRGLGANGVPMSFSETYAAIQTGIVDGGELPVISYIATGINKILPHMTRTNHIYQPTILLMSLKKWNKLSKEEQEILTGSLVKIATVRAGIRKAMTFFEQKHLDGGGIIHDLSDAERKAWRDSYTDEMQQQLIKEIGGQAEEIFKEVLSARNACKK